jgi:hypothetical protein
VSFSTTRSLAERCVTSKAMTADADGAG